MNLVALLVTHVTHEPKMPFARLSQASAQQLVSEMHIFLKKQIAVPIIIFVNECPSECPWKNQTRWVSEGCPLSTEWEVIERGFGGCARARGRIWWVSPGRVPPSKVTFSGDGKLLTKAPSSVAGEMLLLRTALTIVALLMIYNKTNIC